MSSLFTLFRPLRHSGLVLATLLIASKAWGDASLHERYQRLKHGLTTTLPETTISLHSAEQDEALSAEVSSILHYPFDIVSAALVEAENWCRFMPLHFNIKACTHEVRQGEERLNIYSGRKHYQSPEQSYRMAYRFEAVRQDAKQLTLHLSAERGPAGTRDYRIEIEALRVEEGTLLHITSSYRPSMLSTLLTSSYLATLGRDKIGFSHIEHNGESQLVQGIRGVIERNVMRYHLAIDAFLSTPSLPDTPLHEAILTKWFRLNESYPQQLHEMSEPEYMAIKRKEWRNQQQLQLALKERLKLAVAP
jgi:hypothetical protein